MVGRLVVGLQHKLSFCSRVVLGLTGYPTQATEALLSPPHPTGEAERLGRFSFLAPVPFTHLPARARRA
jgi:hypothetical protein